MHAPILHVDADSFFASVAMRTRPHLREVPFAVVAYSYIASANYPARARGVTSAMFTWQALAMCPGLVMIDVDRDEVARVSEALFDIFDAHAASVEPGSQEEAFLDVKARDEIDAAHRAQALRSDVESQLGISVSVGIGRTKLMAKLASRRAKPNGVYTIGEAEAQTLRHTLPLVDVWGIGDKTVERLRLSGYATIGELAGATDDELRHICGLAMSRRLTAIRTGTDDAEVRGLDRRSSLASEGAIAGYGRPDYLPADLLEQCVRRVCRRLSKAGLAASSLSLSLRTSGDRPLHHAKVAIDVPTNDPSLWLAQAGPLLTQEPGGGAITGIKVTLSGLAPVGGITPPMF